MCLSTEFGTGLSPSDRKPVTDERTDQIKHKSLLCLLNSCCLLNVLARVQFQRQHLGDWIIQVNCLSARLVLCPLSDRYSFHATDARKWSTGDQQALFNTNHTGPASPRRLRPGSLVVFILCSVGICPAYPTVGKHSLHHHLRLPAEAPTP